MSKIKVDWGLVPENATELVRVSIGGQRWRNPKNRQYWEMNGDFAGYYSEGSPLDEARVLATRPQTNDKTTYPKIDSASKDELKQIAIQTAELNQKMYAMLDRINKVEHERGGIDGQFYYKVSESLFKEIEKLLDEMRREI